jgi:ABC-type multidrug transport system fused ATPase/permease subunit
MVEMRRNRINSVMFGLVWYFAPLGMNLISFACYIFVAKKELDVATAFTAIALFNMLKMPLTASKLSLSITYTNKQVPAQRVAFMQAYVSVKRIEAFLEEPECDDFVSSLKRDFTKEPAVDTNSQRLGIEGGTFVWVGSERPADNAAIVDVTITSDAGSSTGGQTGPFVLADINIDFPIGKLTLITGPTGSGKTALLNALLGEMDCIAGKVHLVKRAGKRDADGLENTVAFAAQTPWLQYMTIRNNILFGSEYDQERYDLVIDSCCLGPDIAMFEDGDSE